MKPDWDKLMEEYKGHPTKMVGDVDCTAAGKDICSKAGVQSYPTLKWGDANKLEDYSGKRELEDLKKHIDENEKQVCGVATPQYCSADKKAEIEKIKAIPAAERDAVIEKYDTTKAAADAEFKTLVDGLTEQYVENKKIMEDTQEAVKASGLVLMKSILSFKKLND